MKKKVLLLAVMSIVTLTVTADVLINETTFPDEEFRYWVLHQEYGKDSILTEDEIAGVTYLNLFPQNIIAEGHIKSLKGIEHFTAMTKLLCSRNELTELDLSMNTELTWLDCSTNHLTELDLSKNTALTWLDCSGNYLTELDISKNTELTNLSCNANGLTALDVSCYNKLIELNCIDNKLTTLNASGCSALINLKCHINQLTVIDVSNCTSLTTMWTYQNQLSELNVLDCTSLSTLWCGNNQLTQLDVSKNTELKELRCEENLLTALDLSNNKILTSLRTYHNPIKGEAIDALIESLPTLSRGGWCCVWSEDEEGVVTTIQVATAKAKGWISYYWNETAKNWMEYVGFEPTQDEYRPLVEDCKVWKVGGVGSNPVQLVEYYYFEGDTIVGGKVCKQLMRQRYVSPEHPDYDVVSQYPELSYAGAWYEEEQKVYAYDSISNQFKLMYDFSLAYNGTFQMDGQTYAVGPRQTGGIQGFKGVYRDVRLWADGESIYSPTWLEGVGSIDGPTINVYPGPVDPMWFLMACAVDDEVIYLNDEYEDGATPDVMGVRNRFDFTHTIKTKPKAPRWREAEQPLYGEYNEQQLSINLDPLDDTYLVRIADETGKAVYEKTVNAGHIVALNINISTYAAGRYNVTVENEQESFTGVFEAQTTGIEVINKKVEHRGNIYNLHGQRISTLQKGLNIVNGQKFYVK